MWLDLEGRRTAFIICKLHGCVHREAYRIYKTVYVHCFIDNAHINIWGGEEEGTTWCMPNIPALRSSGAVWTIYPDPQKFLLSNREPPKHPLASF